MRCQEPKLMLAASIALLAIDHTAVGADGLASSSASSGLEEIVVTATRREEKLQDVPASISTFSQEKLDAQGIRSIDDLARATPGVLLERNAVGATGNFNDEDTDVNIRGIDSAAGAGTVGIYIDDTPIQDRHISFTSFNAFPALFDLARVEVLRGPQGTLFGAGSEGGTLRFISPEVSLNSDSAYVRSEAATTDKGAPSYEVGGAGGGPIIDGVLGFRLSASYREDGGWVDHVDPHTLAVTDPNSNWQQTITLRAALKWALTDQLTISPSIYYQDLTLGDTGAYWEGLSDPGAGSFLYGTAQRNPSWDPFYLATLKADWELAFAHFTSNTSYYSRKQHSISDYTQFDRSVFLGPAYLGPSGIPPAGDLGTSYDSQQQKNFYQELRLQSVDAAAPVSWTAGFFYAHLNEDTEETVIDPNIDAEYIATYGSSLCYWTTQCPGGPFLSVPELRIVDEQYAVYGDVDWKITSTWKLTGGVRVARLSYTGNFVEYGAFFVDPTVATAATPLVTQGSKTEDPVTPKFALSYQPDANDLFYVSAAKGYRVGGINSGISAGCGLTAPPSYSSDSLWSYEIGAKSTLFGGTLQVDSSLFLIDWKNIQQAVYILVCGQNFIQNLGEARSEGGDLDLQWKATDDLKLDLSLAYVEARYTKQVTAPGATAPSVSVGDGLPGAPWSILASGEYALPVAGDQRPYVRLDYQVTTAQTRLLPDQDSRNLSSDPTLVSLPEVKLLGARAGVRWNGFDWSLFGENLTNAHPVMFNSRDTTTSPLYFARGIRPRTVGITATFRYR
jgi:iron complex outermembrane receptor protein